MPFDDPCANQQRPPRETVTTSEAAGILNLTPRGVQSAIIRGRMRAEKRGRWWYVSVAEVERYRIFYLHTQTGEHPRPDRI